jgi:hypothetical protein
MLKLKKTHISYLGKHDMSPVLFNMNSKHLAKEVLERFGDFKVGGQVICNMKYADDFMLLAKDETMLQGTIETLIRIGRCYEMEINVEKTKVLKISRQPFSIWIMISKTTGECGIFQLFGYHNNKWCKMYT